ncbi:aldose 1-epimerase [Methylopila jiangsuensis]|uniref:Aldose 1-epimerase n=1 Tax=Methylopila jiangsuensis TaxID=586230 RepID=A0A9W6JFM7_9HYPH|nr:aldose 1-epimerase family protein [Methylopila jiangsuensis]MDR6284131.1 galactose mutarotase-like enzyme [Methylopila jiangsuensis]GLK76352.1 aldose 1-epimerase [Methylopila jiangsuensis]
MSDDVWEIAGAGVTARVKAAGAELVSLKDADGHELLWRAGPEWPRHAPVLFPIVGRLKGDALRHGGEARRLTQHGFARDRAFGWVERSATRAVLRLSDDAETRAVYPWPFLLTLDYAADGSTLSVGATVENPGAATLPFALGAHPGFRWPLVDGIAKSDHALVFAARETGPRLPVVDGLLGAPAPLPFDGETLTLSEELFADDALVLPNVVSRGLRYEARGSDGAPLRALTFSWEGYGDLGVWSKPSGAPFLCVEPWAGMASPVDWDGAFADKPGLTLLPPGASARFVWSVTV